MPTFSVIIPTYNRPERLQHAIASVLAQTIQDFEAIVVDDAGERPATVPDDPRIRLIRHRRNQGLAAARNTGLGAATGRFVTFLDDDDVLLPKRLELCDTARPLSLCLLRDESTVAARRRNTPPDHLVDPLDELFVTWWAHPGQCLVDREVCPRFDEGMQYLEDGEWFIRVGSMLPIHLTGEVGYEWNSRSGDAMHFRPIYDWVPHLVSRGHRFFQSHPASEASLWRWSAGCAYLEGHRPQAIRDFWRAFRLDHRVNTLRCLVRSSIPMRPGRVAGWGARRIQGRTGQL